LHKNGENRYDEFIASALGFPIRLYLTNEKKKNTLFDTLSPSSIFFAGIIIKAQMRRRKKELY
jgi:hypothetical protein